MSDAQTALVEKRAAELDCDNWSHVRKRCGRKEACTCQHPAPEVVQGTRTVLALDLSKGSTGYAVAQQAPDGTGRIAEWGTIRPTPAAGECRWPYVAVQGLIDRMNAVLSPHPWFRSGDFSLAVEGGVYGESSSELQYYIGSEFMLWAARREVDAVLYAPSTIKAWAKRWARGPVPPRLEKADMERVWRTDLRPLDPAAFPSSISVTNDAVDAGWIGLLGLYAQAHILPLASDPQPASPLFWDHEDPLREVFRKRGLNVLANVAAPKLTDVAAAMRRNEHLSTLGVGFHPFGLMASLTRHVRAQAALDLPGTREALMRRVSRKTTMKTVTACLEGGAFTCALNRAGHLLLLPETAGFEAMAA